MEDPPRERKGAQSDRSHLHSKAPVARTNAATPVDIKFQGSTPVSTVHPRTGRPATARAYSTGQSTGSKRTNPPVKDVQVQQGANSDRAATVAAVYLGQFHTPPSSCSSPQKARQSARGSLPSEARSHSDHESRPKTSRGEPRSEGRQVRKTAGSWQPSAYHDSKSPEKRQRSASVGLNTGSAEQRLPSTGVRQTPIIEGGGRIPSLTKLAAGGGSGRPVSTEGEPPIPLHPRVNGAVPPLRLLGNIFASNHMPQTLKPQSNPPKPAGKKGSQKTPPSSKAADAGENSPPQALRLQHVQCSKEIAEAFHTRKAGSQTVRPAAPIIRPVAERAALSARSSQDREVAERNMPQTARENGLGLRVAVPPRDEVHRLAEAALSQPVAKPALSYIANNPLAKPAWAEWQPPLPVRTLRTPSSTAGDETKPYPFHEKQSPSPPTVLCHPSSPLSSVCSLDLAGDHSEDAEPIDSCQQRATGVRELPIKQRQLPPAAVDSEERVAHLNDAYPAHMSVSGGSSHHSRASYIQSSSPTRFGRLSSANVSEESAHGERADSCQVHSTDFATQDELRPTPFSFKSAPVSIPSSPTFAATRVCTPLVQSPPNLPRHLIQQSTPCSPNLSRGFMIGQFDGHVPSTSAPAPAQEERDGPLSTRVSNGAASCPGIPRPGLAQQLHESLNNPNALPGYSVGPVIGEGGFCKVRLGTHLVSGERVAIKVIDKTRLTDPVDRKRVAREIRVLKKLNQCDNIIRLLEVGEASSCIHVIMEHASGGTLLDYVRKKKRLTEPEARGCLRQVLVGLAYCHSQGVIHRDIKLENLLLNANREMKIIDFGLSAILVPGRKLRVHCGSPSYAAPEIVSRQLYDGPPVDVWSLGVVLFAMITGYLPFHSSGSNKDELCQRIVSGVYKTPDWISDESRDLLRGMLTTDPRRRLTVEQVADHPWVRGQTQPCWRLPCLTDEPECPPPLNPGILASISKRIDTQSLSESILRGDHTYFTATYHLLAGKIPTDRSKVYGHPDRSIMGTS